VLGDEKMTRQTAAQIATDLIEGGINARHTTQLTAEQYGVSLAVVRKIRHTLLRHGLSMICSMADAIENGWEDERLGLTK